MKIFNLIATVTSIVCVVISIFDKDWSEAGAWFCLTLLNIRDLINNLLSNN